VTSPPATTAAAAGEKEQGSLAAPPAAEPRAPMVRGSAIRVAAMKKELTMLGVLVALCAITAVLNPLFLGADNLRNNVRHISLISLFALGEAVVIIAGGAPNRSAMYGTSGISTPKPRMSMTLTRNRDPSCLFKLTPPAPR